MRQRILILIAIVLLIYFAFIVLSKGGKGSALLKQVPLTTASWTCKFSSVTELSRVTQPVQIRQVETTFTFKGRESQGRLGFENVVNYAGSKFWIDGLEQKPNLAPRIHFDVPRDNQNRPIINRFPDLYPLEVMNTALFFPFLSGQQSNPGDEWIDQFRVTLPWNEQQMIVVLKTKLDDIRTTRECVISYELAGNAYYTIDRDQTPRTPPTKEKCTLKVTGQCVFDPKVALPVELEQQMFLETFDFEMLRNSSASVNPQFARLSQMKNTLKIEVIDRGSVFSDRETPEATPTPESQEDLDVEME